MVKNTFGDSDKFKALVYIENNFDKLNKNQKSYISRNITTFNRYCLELSKLGNTNDKISENCKRNSLHLLKNQFIEKMDYALTIIEDKDMVTHLKNFIIAKVRSLL